TSVHPRTPSQAKTASVLLRPFSWASFLLNRLHCCSLELVQSDLCPSAARPGESRAKLACGRGRPAGARALQERLVERLCLAMREFEHLTVSQFYAHSAAG